MPGPTVFISHTRDDALWAKSLAHELEQCGVATFLRERDIAPGQVMLRRIEQALGMADAAVLVLSVAALADPAVGDEHAALLSQAAERGLRLVPVLHGAASIQVPPLVASRLHADFRGLTPAQQAAKAADVAAALRGPIGNAGPAGSRMVTGLPAEIAQAVRPPSARSDQSSSPAFVVTYAAPDAGYGLRLVDWLHGAGLPAWSIADLTWGSRYVPEIRQRICHAYALLVVMSPDAQESEDVEREILEAMRCSRELFPVLLRGDRNFLLASSWYFDATGGALPGEAELRLLRRIHSGTPVERPQPPALPAWAPSVPGPADAALHQLRALLAEGELAHADVWTSTMLLSAARRLNTGWLEPGDGDRLPLSLLTGIDAAWSAATGGRHGLRAQLNRYRLVSDHGHDLLDAMGAYGWRPADRRATALYHQFVARTAVPPAFFPTLRNPQLEVYRSWYDRWQDTVLVVHLRMQDWDRQEGPR